MKVLVYTTLFPNCLQPNNAIFIKQRMFHFAKLKDCEIKVVAPIPYFPPIPVSQKWFQYSRTKKMEIMDGVEVFHPRYPLIPKISMVFHGFSLFLSSLRLIREVYRTFPFDLIDGHYIYPDGLAAILLGKVFKKPVVLSARGSDIHQFAGFKSIRPMISYTLKTADCVISVCDALKKEMIKLGIESNKIHVIPNGVDTERFQPIDKDEARRELSIPSHGKVIISVGSLVPVKGFGMLLDALFSLKKNSDVYLYIIGKGPEKPLLERKIRELNLTKSAFLVGEVLNSELKTWYNAADLFCLASLREGWPNVIMESLACGTPVVATKAWGIPEVLNSSNLGTLVDRTREALIEGIERGLKISWDRGKLRARVENCDWSETASRIKEVFESVLSKK